MTFAVGSSTLNTWANGGDMTFTSGDSDAGSTGSYYCDCRLRHFRCN